jgi:hypothetical protein
VEAHLVPASSYHIRKAGHRPDQQNLYLCQFWVFSKSVWQFCLYCWKDTFCERNKLKIGAELRALFFLFKSSGGWVAHTILAWQNKVWCPMELPTLLSTQVAVTRPTTNFIGRGNCLENMQLHDSILRIVACAILQKSLPFGFPTTLFVCSGVGHSVQHSTYIFDTAFIV